MSNKSCVGCKVFVADCATPVDDGAVDLCWLCAHAVIVHATPVAALARPEREQCACSREEVYPARVLEERALADAERARLRQESEPAKLTAVVASEPIVAQDATKAHSIAVAAGMRRARVARLYRAGENAE